MKKNELLYLALILIVVQVVATMSCPKSVTAEPSKAQVIKLWQAQFKNAPVIEVTYRGGEGGCQ